MGNSVARKAIFPGSFDPLTNGHLDIIRRGAAMLDELIVAVGHNPLKIEFLPHTTRVEILRQAVADLGNVRVDSFVGLTVEYARRQGVSVLLRGLRNSADLSREFQVALTNRVVGGVETIFLMAGPEHAYTSSSLIKEVARMGGDISALVPPQALPYVQKVEKRK